MPERHYPTFERPEKDTGIYDVTDTLQCQTRFTPRSNARRRLKNILTRSSVSMPERHYPTFEPDFEITLESKATAFQCRNGITPRSNLFVTLNRERQDHAFQCRNG